MLGKVIIEEEMKELTFDGELARKVDAIVVGNNYEEKNLMIKVIKLQEVLKCLMRRVDQEIK